jgi:hypothetical protein
VWQCPNLLLYPHLQHENKEERPATAAGRLLWGRVGAERKVKTARPSADAERSSAQDVRGRDGFHNGCGVPNRRHAAPADDTWQVPRSLLAAPLSAQRTHTCLRLARGADFFSSFRPLLATASQHNKIALRRLTGTRGRETMGRHQESVTRQARMQKEKSSTGPRRMSR